VDGPGRSVIYTEYRYHIMKHEFYATSAVIAFLAGQTRALTMKHTSICFPYSIRSLRVLKTGNIGIPSTFAFRAHLVLLPR
jgi:hypothetical protein